MSALVSVAEWTSPADALPDEGRTVEISVFRNSRSVDVAIRLGDAWWLHRNFGGPVQMKEPSAPAYWRYPARLQGKL